MQEIKIYKHLITVTITDFNKKTEYLKYESTQAVFFDKINNNDFIFFPIHNRTIKTNRVIDVADTDTAEKEFEEFMASLSDEDKKAVKGFIKIYKSSFAKFPTRPIINNFLKDEVKKREKTKWQQDQINNPKKKQLTDMEKFTEKLKANRFRIAVIVTNNILGFSQYRKVELKTIKNGYL